MIISRRKYEQELKEAYEKGCREASERCWQEDQLRRLHCRVDEVETLIRKALEPKEGSCHTNEKCAETLSRY